ncbi:MAG: hypothetical protein ABSF83_03745, partial [Nitrososphaerales archaeon]
MPSKSSPSLRELTFDIPFFEGAGAGPLGSALQRLDLAYFLEMKSTGFAIICRVEPGELEEFHRTLTAVSQRSLRTKVLNRERTGAEILLLEGSWDAFGLDGTEGAEYLKMFRQMETVLVFETGHPVLHGSDLRVSLLVDEESNRRLLDGL